MNMDEILKDYCIHLDEVHKEAEEWDEQINLLQVLDCFKIRKDVYNIAEVLILFIDERISYFQLENFTRTNIRLRKRLSGNLEMTQMALQTLVDRMKKDNLLPNKFFGLRTLRRLSMAITELVSMEIPTENTYIGTFKQANKNASIDRSIHETSLIISPGMNSSGDIPSNESHIKDESNSLFNQYIRFKFNASLTVYMLTLFLDVHLNRSMSDLMITSREHMTASVIEQSVKKHKIKPNGMMNSDKYSGELKSNRSNDMADENNSELVITSFKSFRSKPIVKSGESKALNYHLRIFIRQVENGLMLNLHTTDPILQFEIKTRLEDIKKTFMNIYTDEQYLNELLSKSKIIT